MTLPRPLSSLLSSILLLAGLAATGSSAAQSTLLRLETTLGRIEMQLLDAQAPLTVANFLTYVRAGDYNDLFFSRSVRNFVIQGGGFRWPAEGGLTAITKRASVTNEFSITRSNVRGTVALAKIGGQPSSGSSEWFFNLADNATTLDSQNSGFTVFARVTTEGMAVVDKIAKLPIVDASAIQSVMTDLPIANYTPGTNLARDNVVRISSFTEFAPKTGVTDSERIFSYLEKAYPQYLPPENKVTGNGNGYIYRFFPNTGAYIGTKDNQVWYLVPSLSADIKLLGTMTDYLAKAVADNF